jgi:hypothetical protein
VKIRYGGIFYDFIIKLLNSAEQFDVDLSFISLKKNLINVSKRGGFLYEVLKGIVSRDWTGLHMGSLNRSEFCDPA